MRAQVPGPTTEVQSRKSPRTLQKSSRSLANQEAKTMPNIFMAPGFLTAKTNMFATHFGTSLDPTEWHMRRQHCHILFDMGVPPATGGHPVS